MLFIKRNSSGAIECISNVQSAEFPEQMDLDNAEIRQFMSSPELSKLAKSWLDTSDAEMIRVVEDIVELLLSKNIIQFTELPSITQDKLLRRKRVRAILHGLVSANDNIDI